MIAITARMNTVMAMIAAAIEPLIANLDG